MSATLTPAQRLAALFPAAVLDATTRAEVLAIPAGAAEALLEHLMLQCEVVAEAKQAALTWRRRYESFGSTMPLRPFMTREQGGDHLDEDMAEDSCALVVFAHTVVEAASTCPEFHADSHDPDEWARPLTAQDFEQLDNWFMYYLSRVDEAETRASTWRQRYEQAVGARR